VKETGRGAPRPRPACDFSGSPFAVVPSACRASRPVCAGTPAGGPAL